jgi:tetratricopeptide (TPR) repeat protein
MRELAKKLMQQPTVATQALTVISGSTSHDIAQALADLNRPRLRIGLWPILNNDVPETAMGIATVLGFLLERRQQIRVYRLFAQLEGGAESYEWAIGLSQFGVDDWQLEDLDENVAVWGTLLKNATGWQLILEVESDDFLEDSEEAKSLTYEAESLRQLVAILPKLAAEIASLVGADEERAAAPVYSSVTADDENLNRLLQYLFHWELELLFQMWGRRRPDEEVIAATDELLQIGRTCGDEFAAWAVSCAIARSILPLFEPIHELLAPTIQEVASSIPNGVFPPILFANALFRSGHAKMAYDLLESSLETYPESAESWLALAELYWQGGYINEALDTFQRAIEQDCANGTLFARYGDVLIALDAQGWGGEEFILVSPQQTSANLMAWEAVEAYEAALEIDPSNIHALYQQVILLADLDEARLWPQFARLIEADKTGERVRSAIDSLYHLDDISPATRALQKAIEGGKDRHDLYINLAAAYLVAENEMPARAALEKAGSLTQDEDALRETERLLLAAEDTAFEAHLGEITDLVNAGSSPSIRDVDFLEATLEKAPRFGEVYLLLAKAYQLWGEPDAVLETLLDAQKKLPDDPDVLEMLARELWAAGEQKLAFDSLNKGLAKSPQHVPLLSLTGRYLFENGQEEAARAFLARAEIIAPRHPALNEARVHIARLRG